MLIPEDVLSAEGMLANVIPGFAYREGQLTMANAIMDAMDNNVDLVCEAGTGIGKTMAYLTPLFLQGKRAIVSTATRLLQDQIFEKDLPMLSKALDKELNVIVLKGRSNYLCLLRMQAAQHETQGFSQAQHQQLFEIKEWSQSTGTGDLAELESLDESAAIRSIVTSTSENCLGQACEKYNDCFVYKMRKRAQEADLIITNHYLLLSDMVLREGGFGDLLPKTDNIIFDEAHQLPKLIPEYFSESISSRQLLELVTDTKSAYVEEGLKTKKILKLLDDLEKYSRDFQIQFGFYEGRKLWSEYSEKPELISACETLLESLQAIIDQIDQEEHRGKVVDNVLQRFLRYYDYLYTYQERDKQDFVQWVEIGRGRLSLVRTPINMAQSFQKRLEAYDANIVYTSATLAIDKDAKFLTKELGLEEVEVLIINSPYDYKLQACLYLPPELPDPRSEGFVEYFQTQIIKLIDITQGNTFVLFTSHQMLNKIAETLPELIEYPILKQGEAPKSVLIDRFRETDNAVLLGTASFWEGVDVQGESLSCVIIDKLPFASPDDPILQARLRVIEEQGGNPFMEYQVPQAAMALKQGAGRLIRSETDRGILAICDARIQSKGYGKRFVKALPDMFKTQKLENVNLFMRREEFQESD